MKIRHLLTLVCCWAAASSWAQKGKTNYHISVQSFFNGRTLHQDSVYLNEWGESLHWNQCRWYFSRIRGIKANGDTVLLSQGHYLLDGLAGPASLRFSAAAQGPFQALVLQLGVDPGVNRQGIKTGDLDPAKGMFWTWNTGYIHVKLAGTSAAATTAGQRFTYDIGGYQAPHVTQRNILIPLPTAAEQNGQHFQLMAEWSKIFDAQHAIRIGQQALCHQPGPLAVQLADNAAQVFSLFSKREIKQQP